MTPFQTPIPVRHIGPVVFVLDRTASMATRDCVDGTTSRWEFAVNALRSTIINMAQRDPEQPVMLLTCGTTVAPIAGEALRETIDISNGDASFCIGQAALEAAWHAGEGYVFIIADGVPAQDTHVGELVLENDIAMRALFERTHFLTVGTVDEELAAFARKWPYHDSLENVLHLEGLLVDVEPATRISYSSDDIENAPTEPPPPDLQADGSVPIKVAPMETKRAPAKRGR